MLPQWVETIFQYACQCGRQLTCESVVCIGVARPDHVGQWPKTFVDARCTRCPQTFRFEKPVTKEDIIEAVEILYDQWEAHREPGIWPLDKPPETPATDRSPAPEASAPAPTPAKKTMRPSRRKDQPPGAIGETEVTSFKKALGRTSFRRGSKSFEEFMRSMGVPISNPRTSDKPKRKLRRRDDESHGK